MRSFVRAANSSFILRVTAKRISVSTLILLMPQRIAAFNCSMEIPWVSASSPPRALISSTMYPGTVDEPWETRAPKIPRWFIHSRIATGISLRSFTFFPFELHAWFHRKSPVHLPLFSGKIPLRTMDSYRWRKLQTHDPPHRPELPALLLR